ncbi:RNA polymerase sigma factor [Pontibacter sp. 172403-2]|uniref:RNA polymerase sigma factor n=1 Tax=Pontibacter rufus TaxID=2791028 RepID=UPI0018AFC311|nr:RNA polymerase sigma factor [Pontibacter sp. 172403-2]MBF9252608.1 RNA polymerase sigma factor [Pontibacter sp. 172403-2]
MQATQVKNTQQLSDIEVVRRVLAGEKELYELLMRRHNQKLYRVIRAYLKDECETEDAMQNTYLKAYEKLYQFSGNAQFSTWLIRIGINEALGWLRKNEASVCKRAAQDGPTEDRVLELPDTKAMNPETKMIQQETQQMLEQAIDALPPKYKIVYLLKEVEDMSTSEVTASLHITESNVNVRLHRAKSLLKESLYELSASKAVFVFGLRRCDKLVEKVMAKLA